MRKFLFILAIVGLLLLSGCIKAEIYEKVKPTGKADMKVVVHLDKIFDFYKAMDPSLSDEEIAEKLESNCESKMGVCTVDVKKKILVVEGKDIELKELHQKLEVKKGFLGETYTLKADFMYDENATESIREITQRGGKLTYIISMPGKIVSSDVGKIENNTVIITGEELEEHNEKVVIVSKTGLLSFCPIAFLFPLLVVLAKVKK